MLLKKKIRNKLIISYLLTFALVFGIPCIIFGAIKGWWPLLTFGIICTALGMYIMPIMWVQYAELKGYNAIYESITIDKIYEVKNLCYNFNKSEEKIVNDINYLLTKRYLTGYYFENQKVLKPIENTANDYKYIKCPNCGANLIKDNHKGKKIYCEYCNTTFVEK